MSIFAVIDTETNWLNQVMSIGLVVSDETTMEKLDGRYYVLNPEAQTEGMYSDRLDLAEKTAVCTRRAAMEDLKAWLRSLRVEEIFAYNARFDFGHLGELSEFAWYDIMALAAYRQYNSSISLWEPCCSTGRLRRGYGVEPVLQNLSGDPGYRETHNALLDACDELAIMRLLRQPLSTYRAAARL